MSNTNTAYTLGAEFAEQLNNSPVEAQNWHFLNSTDDLPYEDYATMARELGEVTREIEIAYRDGFNSVFIPLSDE